MNTQTPMFIPKKIIYAVGGITLLVVGAGIGWLARTSPAPSAPLYPSKEERGEQTAAVRDALQSSVSSTTPSSVGEEAVKVVRVVDGDTINVLINGKTEPVRYIGIDTPETVDPRKPVQCFGVESSKKNKELVEGALVRLEKDITDRDKYNRLLRYVWLNNVLINEKLVADGFAKSYSYPPDVKYQERFVAAEKKARENKLGLWTACASGTTIPVSTTPQTPSVASNPSCTIKGNISASGEKIYHLQGCGSYTKTTIDESRGERWFCTEADAQSAGWRRALNCQ